jgi:hypothetical protein
MKNAANFIDNCITDIYKQKPITPNDEISATRVAPIS